jgi:hypothetical protein
MKAIKINVETQRVELVEVEGNSLDSIYAAIGNGCEMFECPVMLSNGDAFYVDEEALIKEMPQVGGFHFKGYSFIGNGLIIGIDTKGAARDVKSDIHEIANQIEFLPVSETQKMKEDFDNC